MKKIIIMSLMLIAGVCMTMGQEKTSQIKFEKIIYDFGTFSDSDPIQKCVFTFTNTGSAPLIINKAMATCGCTVPSFTKTPIQPGEKGQIKVTYDGRGVFPGHFKKTISVFTNGEPSTVRVFIQGEMKETKK